ncbi:MAG: putative zinc transporter msc2 [Piccolia ochrophora]|nr:MAG: putative zinc transporter msc2 [Piccolia ochrophora]
MASTYALPLNGSATRDHHGHEPAPLQSRSFASERLSTPYQAANAAALRKAASNSNLHSPSHTHSSSEVHHDHTHSHSHHLRHHKSSSHLPRQHFSANTFTLNGGLKGMDPALNTTVGAASSEGYGFPTSFTRTRSGTVVATLEQTKKRASTNRVEILTAILLPLPFLLVSCATPSPAADSTAGPADPTSATIANSPFEADVEPLWKYRGSTAAVFTACALTSITLVSIGLLAKAGLSNVPPVQHRQSLGAIGDTSKKRTPLLSVRGGRRLLARALTIGLPFYASLTLGGTRTGWVLLIAAATAMTDNALMGWQAWKRLFLLRKATCMAVLMGLVYDLVFWVPSPGLLPLLLAYLALALSLLAFPLPFPKSASTSISQMQPPSTGSTSAVPSTPWDQPSSSLPTTTKASFSALVLSPEDIGLTLTAGGILSFLSALGFVLLPSTVTSKSVIYSPWSLLAVASAVVALLYAQPSTLQTDKHVGVAVGLTTVTAFSDPSASWPAIVSQVLLSIFSFTAVSFDTGSLKSALARFAGAHQHHHDHRRASEGDREAAASHSNKPHSRLTGFLLEHVEGLPILHSVLSEKDSRRIFYFMCLNFGFMTVQTFYGIVTGSLGLLSDSVHMLFDCLALGVGLAAAVMSKWPKSLRFPYGLGKMDTLAGFANGIFLMLISVEIVTEAIERLAHGSEMKRLGELLTVSSLGLVVNLVGIMAFDHAHHGHGHSHGGHSHGHGDLPRHDTMSHPEHHGHHAHHEPHEHHDPHENHSPEQTGDGAHPHPQVVVEDHTHAHAHAPSPPHQHKHSHGHHHSHGNDNMHGIFLHILADALGSVAVVISTLLVHYFSWSGFDPLASCIIAILIFASAIPLVISSAKRLLLTIPADTEYHLRDTLTGISGLRGVAGYCVPRFWLEDADRGGVFGVMHVGVGRAANVEETRERVVEYLRTRGTDVVVQVEREGEGRCWCGGAGNGTWARI